MLILVACSKTIEDDIRSFFTKIKDVEVLNMTVKEVLMNELGIFSIPEKKYVVLDNDYIYNLEKFMTHINIIKGLYFIKNTHAEEDHRDFIKYEANYPQNFLTSYYSMIYSPGMVKSILRFLGCKEDTINMDSENIVVADDRFSITSKANV